MGSSPAGCQGAKRDASEFAVGPALSDEFLHGAPQPRAAIALAKPVFEEGFEDARGAVRMIPHQVLGIEAGPVFFEDAVKFVSQVAPHLGLRVGSDDGDLRDVEFERSQGAQVRGDGFGSFRRQANDVVTLGVKRRRRSDARPTRRPREPFRSYASASEISWWKLSMPNRAPSMPHFAPAVEIAQQQVDAGLHKPVEAVTRLEVR